MISGVEMTFCLCFAIKSPNEPALNVVVLKVDENLGPSNSLSCESHIIRVFCVGFLVVDEVELVCGVGGWV